MLVSSGASVNVLNKKEKLIELMIEHSALITEFFNNRTIEVDIDGNIIWEKSGLNVPHDAERLDNGNTLITIYGTEKIIEVNRDGEKLWIYPTVKGSLPMDAERLPNGNTLIAQYGNGKVIEIDSTGNIVWEVTGLHKPMDAERLPNGNTLIAEGEIYPDGRVLEVDSTGNEVWNISNLGGPVDIERLYQKSRGYTTLVTTHPSNYGGNVTEYDENGDIIWQKTGLHNPSDAERLPNGNTLISENGALRVIEIDYNGNIVWQKTGLFYPTDVESSYNHPPDTPDINGPLKGTPGVEYDYTFISNDPDDDDISFEINWGDGESETSDYYPSGTEVIVRHTWNEKGTLTLKARACDSFECCSDWNEITVTIPRDKTLNYILFERLFEQFPILQ
jgi:hypothetical protein